MITEILSFLQIFIVRKHNTPFFKFSENLQKIRKKTIFLAYVGPLKANYRSFLRLLTLHCFVILTTVFCMHIIIYPYLFLLFSHFVFLISLSLSYSSRHEHILQFTMFYIISLQIPGNITELKVH